MIAKEINNPEELKKNICTKYDMNNNVLTALNALTFRTTF
jgi:pyrroline-5-carboxylate reductase